MKIIIETPQSDEEDVVIVRCAAIYMTISGQQMDSMILWEILISGIITALPSALLVCFDAKSGKISLLLWFVHFMLIFFTTLILLKIFGWCSITPISVLITFLAVVFIYLFTCYLHYLIDRRHVSLMNQQLKKRYTNKENQ
ncbi:MAG: DUF3021 family protein [Oscillospiraceae bacterium]|nr:DUF3021 family protein [Oscillospiraceae bacterium]